MAEPIMTVVKIILDGQSGVGKTSLMMRETDNTFNQNWLCTIGVDFKFKKYVVKETHVKAQIWDGQDHGSERYKSVITAYYRRAQCMAFCFSLCDEDYYLQDIEERIKTARSINQQATMFLIGCKADQEQIIFEESIIKFAENHKIKYFKTSSKKNQGVHQAFQQIVQEALKVQQNEKIKPAQTAPPALPAKQKKDCEIM